MMLSILIGVFLLCNEVELASITLGTKDYYYTTSSANLLRYGLSRVYCQDTYGTEVAEFRGRENNVEDILRMIPDATVRAQRFHLFASCYRSRCNWRTASSPGGAVVANIEVLDYRGQCLVVQLQDNELKWYVIGCNIQTNFLCERNRVCDVNELPATNMSIVRMLTMFTTETVGVGTTATYECVQRDNTKRLVFQNINSVTMQLRCSNQETWLPSTTPPCVESDNVDQPAGQPDASQGNVGGEVEQNRGGGNNSDIGPNQNTADNEVALENRVTAALNDANSSSSLSNGTLGRFFVFLTVLFSLCLQFSLENNI